MTNEQAVATPRGLFKDILVITGLIGFLVTLLTVLGTFYWLQSASEPVSTVAPAAAAAVDEARPRPGVPAPAAPAMHADVYFDFKSARLRADAARLLQDNAAMLARTESWVILVTGYADRQGPAVYNRALAQRRAENVKQFLVELGVPEGSVKVVTVGQEAMLCDDPGQECQQLNRRVHLEIRGLGPVARTPAGPKPQDVAQP